MGIGKCLSLRALSAVFGVSLLSQSVDAQPVVSSISVSSPAAGAILAPGGTVTVQIEANEFGSHPTLTALAWLVSDEDSPASVLFDFTAEATTEVDNLILGALQQNSAYSVPGAAGALASLQSPGGPSMKPRPGLSTPTRWSTLRTSILTRGCPTTRFSRPLRKS